MWWRRGFGAPRIRGRTGRSSLFTRPAFIIAVALLSVLVLWWNVHVLFQSKTISATTTTSGVWPQDEADLLERVKQGGTDEPETKEEPNKRTEPKLKDANRDSVDGSNAGDIERKQGTTVLPMTKFRMLNTRFKFSPATNIPWELINEQESIEPPPADSGPRARRYGGYYNGSHMYILRQVSLSSRQFSVLLTAAERNKSGAIKVPYIPWTASIWALFGSLIKQNWTVQMNSSDAPTLVISRGEIPRSLDPRRQLINSIGKFSCLAGNKQQQLMCRREYAEMHGCDLDDLNISPVQYDIRDRESCERFLAKANTTEQQQKMFLLKSITTAHGDGIRIFHGPSGLLEEIANCDSPGPFLIMDYVDKPALVDGRKVDVRSFLLVASLVPKLAFYHDGYARLSSANYSRDSLDQVVHISNSRSQTMFEGRFMNFSQLAITLEEQHPDLIRQGTFLRYLRRRAKAVTRFVIEAAMTELRHSTGRFHLLAMDWSVDERGRLGLLEVNASPMIANFPLVGLTPKIWNTAVELVTLIQTNPQKIKGNMLVKEGFRHEGWKLVYNELEAWYDRVHGKPYNVCQEFRKNQRWDIV